MSRSNRISDVNHLSANTNKKAEQVPAGNSQSMRYLVIDASLGGTGIRDKYEGGYLSPEKIGLSSATIQRLNARLSKYETEHYNGFVNDNIIDELDREGKKIALMIKSELSEVKLEYFSDARMENEMI